MNETERKHDVWWKAELARRAEMMAVSVRPVHTDGREMPEDT
ncbi:MAG TPA: hypothetical protein VM115_10705 [Vicinamibacterales bacterium]|nr:hypothetical protein [Vicinamibacterales bacterium]